MGLRFRQSFQLFPGVRLNVGAGGVSASFGIPGATVNVGRRGIRSTVGIPGSGLSYTTNHSSPRGREGAGPTSWPDSDTVPHYLFDQSGPPPGLSHAYLRAAEMREIGSASVEQLTSHSLVNLRDMIAQARLQRHEIDDDLGKARRAHAHDTQDLARRKRSIFRYFYKRKLAELEISVPETGAEIERLTAWQGSTHIDMRFDTSDAAQRAYGSLVHAFDALRLSKMVWDCTSDRDTNRVIERSYASRTIARQNVKLDFGDSDLVRFEGRAMRFGNVNGEDILIYPGFVLMPRADAAFALVDLREIVLDFRGMQFVEEEAVPSDAQIIHETWAKVNKNGSPDLRFKDNYRIPVCLYGRILFTSPGGIEEEYQFSNFEAAGNFARAFDTYQAALSSE